MHKTSLLLFVAASALAQAQVNSTAGPALDVPGHEISSGSGALPSGVRVHYKSVATPDDRNVNLIATGIAMAPNGLHRFLIDKTTQSYFGYDLVIGPQGADRRYWPPFNRSAARPTWWPVSPGTGRSTPCRCPNTPRCNIWAMATSSNSTSW